MRLVTRLALPALCALLLAAGAGFAQIPIDEDSGESAKPKKQSSVLGQFNLFPVFKASRNLFGGAKAEPKKTKAKKKSRAITDAEKSLLIQKREYDKWMRRVEACEKIREIADRKGDEKMRALADRLINRAFAIYQRKSNNAMRLGTATSTPLLENPANEPFATGGDQ